MRICNRVNLVLIIGRECHYSARVISLVQMDAVQYGLSLGQMGLLRRQMPRRHVLRAQEGCRCDCMMILQPYSAFRRVRSIHIAVACVAICVQPPLCSMASFQDAYLAFGMFVRIPVRGCLLGLRLVRWGSMSLHGLCGAMCHLRYSMCGGRCAPPQKLCITGAKLFGEGGQLPYLHTALPQYQG